MNDIFEKSTEGCRRTQPHDILRMMGGIEEAIERLDERAHHYGYKKQPEHKVIIQILEKCKTRLWESLPQEKSKEEPLKWRIIRNVMYVCPNCGKTATEDDLALKHCAECGKHMIVPMPETKISDAEDTPLT